MQTSTKILIGLGLAAATAAYFVFRPKKISTISSNNPSSGGTIFGKPKPMPLNPTKPLPFKVRKCPDGEMLVGENCVPDKAILLTEYQNQEYSYKAPYPEFYDARTTIIV